MVLMASDKKYLRIFHTLSDFSKHNKGGISGQPHCRADQLPGLPFIQKKDL
jgi:hypothetical protein